MKEMTWRACVIRNFYIRYKSLKKKKFYNVYFADLKRRVCQRFGGAGAGLLVFSVECINDKTIKCVCNTCEQ